MIPDARNDQGTEAASPAPTPEPRQRPVRRPHDTLRDRRDQIRKLPPNTDADQGGHHDGGARPYPSSRGTALVVALVHSVVLIAMVLFVERSAVLFLVADIPGRLVYGTLAIATTGAIGLFGWALVARAVPVMLGWRPKTT